MTWADYYDYSKLYEMMRPGHEYDRYNKGSYTISTSDSGHISRKQLAINSITNVIFNNPATIVFWSDGTKTVVKCDERDEFDPEKGLAMAICKKHFGGGFYNDIFKKWIPKEETPEIEIDGQITMDDIAEKFEKLAKAAKSMFGPWDD